jgi:hypothetical protein
MSSFENIRPPLRLADIDRLTSITATAGDELILTSDGALMTLNPDLPARWSGEDFTFNTSDVTFRSNDGNGNLTWDHDAAVTQGLLHQDTDFDREVYWELSGASTGMKGSTFIKCTPEWTTDTDGNGYQLINISPTDTRPLDSGTESGIGINVSLARGGAHSGTVTPTTTALSAGISHISSFTMSSDRTIADNILHIDSVNFPTINSASNHTWNYTIINDTGLISVTDSQNTATCNVKGFDLNGSYTMTAGSTSSIYGFYYDPTVSNMDNEYAFYATRSGIALASDYSTSDDTTGYIRLGAGGDSEIGYDGSNLVLDSAIVGTGAVQAIGPATGALGDFDLIVGSSGNYGMARVGNATFGTTAHSTGSLDLDGTVLFKNQTNPSGSNILFVWMEQGNDIRFALPKSAVGNATYNPRSFLCAGPAPNDDTMVTVGYWQGEGIFDNLTCDTSGSGADCGIQGALEVESDIFCDSFKESTSAAGITFNNDIEAGVDGTGISMNWYSDASGIGLHWDHDATGTNPYLLQDIEDGRASYWKISGTDSSGGTMTEGILAITPTFDTTTTAAGSQVMFFHVTDSRSIASGNHFSRIGVGKVTRTGTKTSTGLDDIDMLYMEFADSMTAAAAGSIQRTGLNVTGTSIPTFTGDGAVTYRGTEVSTSAVQLQVSGAPTTTIDFFGMDYKQAYSATVTSGSTTASMYGLYFNPTTTANPAVEHALYAVESGITLASDATNGAPTMQEGAIRLGAAQDAEIYWDGTDLILDATGVSAGAVDIPGDLVVDGEVQGSRCLLVFGDTDNRTSDSYHITEGPGRDRHTNAISPHGYTMPRAGSIVGISMSNNITVHSVDSTIQAWVYKNDNTGGDGVFGTGDVTIDGTGVFKGQATQARGTDTFSAGDTITTRIEKAGGTFTIAESNVIVEVQFDT